MKQPAGRERKDIHAIRRHADRMFELGRQALVAGHGRPVIGQNLGLGPPEVHHRLDGEEHAFFKHRTGAGAAVMQHVRRRVKDLAERFAAALNELGVEPGQKVMMYIPNSIQWVVSLLGIQKAGAVCVPITPIYTPHDLSYIANDSGAETIVCADTNFGYVRKVLSETPLKRVVVSRMADLLPWWKRAYGMLFDIPGRPHVENLCNCKETAPDRIGDLASNRHNARLRYELVPYLYSLAHRAHRFGEPVMPPLEDLAIHREMDPSEFEDGEDNTPWRCRICGYVHYGDEPPEECPYCFFPKSAFKEI